MISDRRKSSSPAEFRHFRIILDQQHPLPPLEISNLYVKQKSLNVTKVIFTMKINKPDLFLDAVETSTILPPINDSSAMISVSTRHDYSFKLGLSLLWQIS